MPLREVYERTTIRTYERVADDPAELVDPGDPFLIDDPCSNAGGHYPVASCGAVVCVHCARIFWQ